MLRIPMLAAACLALTVPPAIAAGRASSWSSAQPELPAQGRYNERYNPRAAPGYRAPPFQDELSGNCAGLTVMAKTRIERLKALEEKAGRQPWPPLSPMAQWARPPTDGDAARQREQIARLNAALGAKGCQTVDVSAEIRRAPVPPAKAGGR